MNIMRDSPFVDLLAILVIIAVAIVSEELMLGILAILLLRIIRILSNINKSIQEQNSLNLEEVSDD